MRTYNEHILISILGLIKDETIGMADVTKLKQLFLDDYTQCFRLFYPLVVSVNVYFVVCHIGGLNELLVGRLTICAFTGK